MGSSEEDKVAHEEKVETAAEEIAEEVTEIVEEKAEEVTKETPIETTTEEVEDEVSLKVQKILEEKYGIHPKSEEVEVEAEETVADSDPAPVVTPVSEHWKNKRVGRRRK